MGSLLIVDVCFEIDQIEESGDRAVLDHRYEKRADGNSECRTECIERLVEAALRVIELVYEERLRNSRIGCVLPGKLRTDLNTRLTVDNDKRGIGNSYALHYLSGKIKITGSVKNIYLAVFPVDGSDC